MAESNTYYIAINQKAVTANNFPRSAKWWRHFLPRWATRPRWWDTAREDDSVSRLHVDETTGVLTIRVNSHRQADTVRGYLLNCSALRLPEWAIQGRTGGTP
ncbi:hypothetical protein GCM10012275_54930 [Longimycelium tulufanense]|uniref:Uncharacterized protein n=1 Tax=Longimycelium tulufanense TaxID=907463 RepID=A0A8J3CJP3_9PSEU|nr:hypothetical protein [Longimycelium tulufanense]GGM77281.1 hypothetical protein GCM10012275_54930 [Longimycelium tulufanense]